MATAEQWFGKLAHLKVDKARGDPAPHKPLLLLVVPELATALEPPKTMSSPIIKTKSLISELRFR